jgi:hypothetical protein
MKTWFQKSLLTYWQEIVFIVSIGILLFEITKFCLNQHTIDGWDIALLSFSLPLFTGLIIQLFWFNRTLSIVLSVLLSIGSFVFILMAFYFLGTTSSQLIQAISMLMLGIFLLFAGLTMTRKKPNYF